MPPLLSECSQRRAAPVNSYPRKERSSAAPDYVAAWLQDLGHQRGEIFPLANRACGQALTIFLSREQADDSLSLTFLPEAPVG
jgi:hypothetical protein